MAKDLTTPAQRRLVETALFRDAVVRLDWSGSAQVIDPDGIPRLGTLSGPVRTIAAVIHEACHFVEIDDDRMTRPGWGLRYPEVFIFDRMCVEPRTTQGVEREVRVLAYQENVLDFLGIEEESGARSLAFLPDFGLIECRGDAAKYTWISGQIAEKRRVYTLDRFMAEWSRKNNLLRERLRNGPLSP